MKPRISISLLEDANKVIQIQKKRKVAIAKFVNNAIVHYHDFTEGKIKPEEPAKKAPQKELHNISPSMIKEITI